MIKIFCKIILPIILFAMFSHGAFTNADLCSFLRDICLSDLVDKLREARLYITNLNRVSGVIARRLAIIFFRLNPSMVTWTVVSRSSFGEDSSYRGRHSRLSTKNILKTLNGCPSSLSMLYYRIDRSVRERLYEYIISG